jgi:hypothetical protein
VASKRSNHPRKHGYSALTIRTFGVNVPPPESNQQPLVDQPPVTSTKRRGPAMVIAIVIVIVMERQSELTGMGMGMGMES